MFGLFKTKNEMFKNITAVEFKKMMDTHKDVVIVDVRSENEAREGIIKGAKVINLMSANFKQNISKLPKDKHILVYCRSGQRSSQACRIMSAMGYTSVFNLKGGIMGWNYGLR